MGRNLDKQQSGDRVGFVKANLLEVLLFSSRKPGDDAVQHHAGEEPAEAWFTRGPRAPRQRLHGGMSADDHQPELAKNKAMVR